MPSLNYFLDRADQSIESLKSHEFKSPGIFTNAIVNKPDIMKLLKDPSIDENSLYKINRIGNRDPKIDMKPERKDGRPSYTDQSFNEYITQQNNKSKERKTAVIIPKLIIRDEGKAELNSSPTKSAPNNSHTVYFDETDDVGDMCNKILDLIDKYPNLINNYEEIYTKLINYKENSTYLSEEITQLEQDIFHQRQQLNYLNINYSDLNSPTKSGSEPSQEIVEEDDMDVDEYILQEEAEIQELEERLNERQRLSIS